ncbi:hypothetical protein K435DRAFT_808640 [Dendrothele bispora CBS 962.96]|uniref:Uncharacterized protein n=1 Tax=Dendrothele bispora (strain CBS 962.96) TaxID=1314807 RepID=A0A4S8L0S9_DENBC|nr:hypothetical protein K435DRAFT_808640 [Dendrothele bispora CBS 962.96]
MSGLTPAQRLIQKTRMRQASRSGSPTPASPNANDESPVTGVSTPSSIVSNNQPTIRSDSAVARQIKEEYTLDMHSICVFDRHCGMTLEERNLRLFASCTKVLELVQKLSTSEEWSITPVLESSIRQHSFTFLLSPKLTSYLGDIAKNVIDALRVLGVAELPGAHEVGKLTVVQHSVKKFNTSDRYQIKSKIAKGIKNNSDIATLTSAIVGEKSKSIAITAALYRRVAFLRWAATEFKSSSGDKWWDDVDMCLLELRTAFQGDAVGLHEVFETRYHEDIEMYGDPANTGSIISITDIPAHQATLDSYAAKVTPKSSTTKQVSKRSAEEAFGEDLFDDRTPPPPPGTAATPATTEDADGN